MPKRYNLYFEVFFVRQNRESRTEIIHRFKNGSFLLDDLGELVTKANSAIQMGRQEKICEIAASCYRGDLLLQQWFFLFSGVHCRGPLSLVLGRSPRALAGHEGMGIYSDHSACVVCSRSRTQRQRGTCFWTKFEGKLSAKPSRYCCTGKVRLDFRNEAATATGRERDHTFSRVCTIAEIHRSMFSGVGTILR